MTIGQLDLPFFKQEIKELIRFGDIKVIALLDSSSLWIWHHYCLLAPIPFGCSNLFFFVVLITVINRIWIIGFDNCDTFLESGISAHVLELAIEHCHSLSQLTQVVKLLSQQLLFPCWRHSLNGQSNKLIVSQVQ